MKQIETSVFQWNSYQSKHTIEPTLYLTGNKMSEIKGIKHGFSTRYGGVSKGAFQSMNLGLSRNDHREDVIKNYQIICEAMDVDFDKLVLSYQIHEDKIVEVDAKDFGKGIHCESDIIGVDGLMTQTEGLVLTTFYADCTPLYFVDPVKRGIGLVHSGWRSTALNIGGKMIRAMIDKWDSNPEDIHVLIGPAILKCCFEVGYEVIEIFKPLVKSIENYYTSHGDNKYLLDLQGIIIEQLLTEGIVYENIAHSDLCTKCHPETFFSHRAHGNQRGSLAAFMSLTNMSFER